MNHVQVLLSGKNFFKEQEEKSGKIITKKDQRPDAVNKYFSKTLRSDEKFHFTTTFNIF